MSDRASDCEVLVAGAGPTGLVLALWLARLGVRLRIIDKAAEPGTTSRAIAVQARTLELYRQVGLADDVVRAGLPFVAANLWNTGAPVGRIPFGDMGTGKSPFPYVLSYAQDEHERLLIARLAELGVTVERPLELVDHSDNGERVVARLRGPDGKVTEQSAVYLAGCDGARST